MLYEVYDTKMQVTYSAGHTLWGALALCRSCNTRGRCPGRYCCRPCVA